MQELLTFTLMGSRYFRLFSIAAERSATDNLRMPLLPFQVMIKPVCGQCNLACAYCYYAGKPAELYPGEPRTAMSTDTLRETVRQYVAAKPDLADFCWQGGEPLLAGKEFFRQAVAFQQEFGRPGQAVGNALQTNGTLLDDEWCELFARYNFFLGLSLDGPADIHDVHRRDRAGQGSFAHAWQGLERLRKHRVEFNVLTTVHEVNVRRGKELYRFFVDRGLRYLQFIPIVEQQADGRPQPYSCRPEDYGRFLLEVFAEWMRDGVGVVSERFFDSILHTLVKGEAAVCWHMARCPKALIVEWNGDVYPCDHFVTRDLLMGNILSASLTQIAASPVFERFQKAKARPPAVCLDCEFSRFCKGGCPKHHRGTGRLDPQRVNYFCESYKVFFKQALPEFRTIARQIRKRQ
jgi:uncharacterized protein